MKISKPLTPKKMQHPSILISKYLQALVLIMFCLPAFAQQTASTADPNVEVKRIWDQAPHNAFTDLIRFKGRFYCTFREAINHYDQYGKSNGKIRVIVSENGEKWEDFALIEKEGIDLRDPNLSITPNGQLMLMIGFAKYGGGRLHSRHSHRSLLNNSTNKFSEPEPVKYSADVIANSDNPDMNWLWRVIWHKGQAYGVIYEEHDQNGAALKTNRLNLVKSNDGINYELVKNFPIAEKPDETALRFGPDGQLYVMVRMEGSPPHHTGLLGRSKAPYKDWEMVDSKVKIGGPNIIFTKGGNLLLGTRTYDNKIQKTALFATDAAGQFKRLIEFPSGDDSSYPGMVIHNDHLYFSYYSSHEGGKSNIYFTKIPMAHINQLTGKKPVLPFK
jgi:hypothetical protein